MTVAILCAAAPAVVAAASTAPEVTAHSVADAPGTQELLAVADAATGGKGAGDGAVFRSLIHNVRQCSTVCLTTQCCRLWVVPGLVWTCQRTLPEVSTTC